MNHGYVAYDKQDNPTYFFQCEIEKLCKHIGTTVANFKEKCYTSRKKKSIGNDYTVYMLDEEDTLILLIGEDDSSNQE